MKHIRFYTIFALLVLMATSCQNGTINEDERVYLHIQSSFSNDQVQVKFDGNEVYNNLVSTNHVLGLADVDSTTLTSGNHEIAVIVNNTFTHTELFNHDQAPYICINFDDSDNTISIEYFYDRPMYD